MPAIKSFVVLILKVMFFQHNNDKLFLSYDHNVIPVWKTCNITGRGVSVSVLDDGKSQYYSLI